MNGALRKPDIEEALQDQLETAALQVHFGEADPESWELFEPEECRHGSVVRARTSLGLAGSFVIHAILLSMCGLIATGLGDSIDKILFRDAILASFSEDDILDDEVFAPNAAQLNLEPDSGPASRRSAVMASMSELMEEGEPREVAPEDVAPVIANEEAEEEQGVGSGGVEQFRFQKPAGGRSVTKGSFTVWTEPLDPLPNQPYVIVVQFRVPKELKSFPKSDLKIDVVGTDTFHLKLPDPRRGFKLIGELPVIDGQTQLLIPIPGAPSLVQDAIRIESRKILKEQQSLLIEF